MRNPLKIVWIALGFLCLGFGTIERICIMVVWICHILYFFLRIKTEKTETGMLEGGE
jgi:uncharacterized protein